jgi:hypothetical protein
MGKDNQTEVKMEQSFFRKPSMTECWMVGMLIEVALENKYQIKYLEYIMLFG